MSHIYKKRLTSFCEERNMGDDFDDTMNVIYDIYYNTIQKINKQKKKKSVKRKKLVKKKKEKKEEEKKKKTSQKTVYL